MRRAGFRSPADLAAGDDAGVGVSARRPIRTAPALALVLGLGTLGALGLAACGTLETTIPAKPDTPMLVDASPPMTWAQLSALPVPATPAAERLAYGPAPQQFLRLRLPPGASREHPAPLVWLLHGGCWQNEYSADYVEPLAAWLASQGYATANVEFRRVGDPGGGWPGTFDDLRAAAGQLPAMAAQHPELDASRTVAVGHSAGGHLALWMMQSGLTTRGAVGLAAIADLARYNAGAKPDSCGASVAALLGGTPAQVPERYQAVDPILHRPLVSMNQRAVLLTGSKDTIVPAAQAEEFVAKAAWQQMGLGKQAGTAWRRELDGRGHFDLAAPGGPTGQALVAALAELTKPVALAP